MIFPGLRYRKYLENISWLLLEKAFTLLVGLLVGVYVARYLKPEAFGLLNYAISFVSLFAAFSALGMDQILARELAREQEKHPVLLGTGFILKMAGSAILLLLMLGVVLFMGHSIFTNTLILIIAIAELFKGFEVVNHFFQAKVMSKNVVQVQLVANLLISFSKIALVLLHAPLIWFALIIVIGSAANAAGYILAYRKSEGSLWHWNFDKTLAYRLLAESWPLALYGVALHVQARIDQVMLGKMLNTYEVGQYAVALKFVEVIGFVPMVLISTFSPAVVKAKAISEALYHDRLVNLYRLLFLAFLVIALPIYFFSEQVVSFLYGSEYQAAGYLLSLFALRLFFTNMGVGKSVFIVNESLFKYSLLTVTVGAAVNITLNYVLIPHYGSVGSIVASLLSFTVSIFLVDLLFSKTRENQRLMMRGIFTFWRIQQVN
jgi:O-antigen/teichoic acid export membrane protein